MGFDSQNFQRLSHLLSFKDCSFRSQFNYNVSQFKKNAFGPDCWKTLVNPVECTRSEEYFLPDVSDMESTSFTGEAHTTYTWRARDIQMTFLENDGCTSSASDSQNWGVLPKRHGNIEQGGRAVLLPWLQHHCEDQARFQSTDQSRLCCHQLVGHHQRKHSG